MRISAALVLACASWSGLGTAASALPVELVFNGAVTFVSADAAAAADAAGLENGTAVSARFRADAEEDGFRTLNGVIDPTPDTTNPPVDVFFAELLSLSFDIDETLQSGPSGIEVVNFTGSNRIGPTGPQAALRTADLVGLAREGFFETWREGDAITLSQQWSVPDGSGGSRTAVLVAEGRIVALIPEPLPAALLAIGAVALAASRRRRVGASTQGRAGLPTISREPREES